MALKQSEEKEIAEDLRSGSGSSESSDDVVGVCRIRPLTATTTPQKKPKQEVTAGENNGSCKDDDDEDEDELVIDEEKTGVEQSEKASGKTSYKRQVSTPLKKRKLQGTTNDKPMASIETKQEEMKTTASSGGITTFGLPPGWTRKCIERMSGVSAGKIDVYLTSPEGKRCRSMKEVVEHLEKTKSSYTRDDFIFKPPNLKSATPAAIRSPAKSPKKRPVKRSSSSSDKETQKKKTKKEKVAVAKASKTKVAKERKKRSPVKSASLQKKIMKEPRQVRKPPPEKASVKASKQQKFQKLLVKINFQQKAAESDDQDESEDDDDDVDDSFDEGSDEEEMETPVPTTPPKKSPRGARNSFSE